MPGFNAANPLVLQPGDGGILTSDGTNWYFEGEVSFEGAEILLTDNIVTVANHGLGKIPAISNIVLRCKIAEQNWAIGDEVYPGTIIESGPNQGSGILSFTPLAYRFNNALFISFPPVFQNKTTGARFTLTPANWRIVVRLTAIHY
jgi:hypothetical protein